MRLYNIYIYYMKTPEIHQNDKANIEKDNDFKEVLNILSKKTLKERNPELYKAKLEKDKLFKKNLKTKNPESYKAKLEREKTRKRKIKETNPEKYREMLDIMKNKAKIRYYTMRMNQPEKYQELLNKQKLNRLTKSKRNTKSK